MWNRSKASLLMIKCTQGKFFYISPLLSTQIYLSNAFHTCFPLALNFGKYLEDIIAFDDPWRKVLNFFPVHFTSILCMKTVIFYFALCFINVKCLNFYEQLLWILSHELGFPQASYFLSEFYIFKIIWHYDV